MSSLITNSHMSTTNQVLALSLLSTMTETSERLGFDRPSVVINLDSCRFTVRAPTAKLKTVVFAVVYNFDTNEIILRMRHFRLFENSLSYTIDTPMEELTAWVESCYAAVTRLANRFELDQTSLLSETPVD